MRNDEALLYQESRREMLVTLFFSGMLLAALGLAGYYAPGLLVAAVL